MISCQFRFTWKASGAATGLHISQVIASMSCHEGVVVSTYNRLAASLSLSSWSSCSSISAFVRGQDERAGKMDKRQARGDREKHTKGSVLITG